MAEFPEFLVSPFVCAVTKISPLCLDLFSQNSSICHQTLRKPKSKLKFHNYVKEGYWAHRLVQALDLQSVQITCLHELSRSNGIYSLSTRWLQVQTKSLISIYRLLDSLVVECWHRVREVQDSIPSQGPCHIKDVMKNGTSSSLVLAVVAGMKKQKTTQNRQKSNAKQTKK